MNEQWFVEILLNDRCSITVLGGQLLDDVSNLTQTVGYLDSSSSVRVLTWFDDPNICIFLLLKLLVGTREPIVLCVSCVRSLHIESQRNSDFEWIDAHRSVVGAHIQEQRFFV